MSNSNGPLTCQKALFYLPEEVTYLNCAYFSPSLRSADTALQKGIEQHNRPYLISVGDFFEPIEVVKKLFCKVINATDPQRIAIIPSASYGVATVMNNVRLTASENIVLLEEQFPSNVYAYMEASKKSGAELRTVKAPFLTEERGAILNQNLLKAIDSNTAIVAIPQVHWADGIRLDLQAVRKRCDETKSLLIIDGTQSIGALPFDMATIKPDALICGAYKWLLGPYSIGLAYYGPYFDDGDPIEYSWINRRGSENFTDLVNFRDELRAKAFRYNVGECSNFILIPMLIESLQQILSWGVKPIQNYCEYLFRPFLPEIESKGYHFEKEYQASHIIGLYLHPQQKVQTLVNRFKEKSIFVSFRGKAIRVSPNVYNDEQHLERLVDNL
jgi:selenocysteine lyase/cysteine desulfurase